MKSNLKSRSQMKRVAVQDPYVLIHEIEQLRDQNRYLLGLLVKVVSWKNEWNKIEEVIMDTISKNR